MNTKINHPSQKRAQAMLINKVLQLGGAEMEAAHLQMCANFGSGYIDSDSAEVVRAKIFELTGKETKR